MRIGALLLACTLVVLHGCVFDSNEDGLVLGACIGDSNTAPLLDEEGHPAGGAGHWCEELDAQTPNIAFENLGVSGSLAIGGTKPDGLAQLAQAAALQPRPDFVMLAHLSNDIGQGADAATALARMRLLYDTAVAYGFQVFVGTVPPRFTPATESDPGGDPHGLQPVIDETNVLLRAEFGTHIIDFDTGFSFAEDFWSDGIHICNPAPGAGQHKRAERAAATIFR